MGARYGTSWQGKDGRRHHESHGAGVELFRLCGLAIGFVIAVALAAVVFVAGFLAYAVTLGRWKGVESIFRAGFKLARSAPGIG